MTVHVPIGIDDFRQLRELDLEYVDKSDLIRQLLDRPGTLVTLLPRPRRFGKTLNLSMLRYFFEKRDEDLWHLFKGLAIDHAGDAYRAYFQRYAVIYLSLKETKFARFEDTWSSIKRKIEAAFGDHSYLLDSPHLDEWEKRNYRVIRDGTADPSLYQRALYDLSTYLHAHHGEKVVILIDEYDEPIHAAHLNGYAPQILEFMRAFLGAGLKGNTHLFKAVVTGILRVAKENIFSGLNNLAVHTLLSTRFQNCFGFTEAEVLALLTRAGRAESMADVRAWYNGYRFGDTVIYNPWSVLNFLDSEQEAPKPYWLSTSSNDLIRELIERYAVRIEEAFETLMRGERIERRLDENVALGDLYKSEESLWSLLVFAGYLRAEEARIDALGRVLYGLSIPNREVRLLYADTFHQWMVTRMEGHRGDIHRLTRALLGGDAEELEEQLQAFVTNLLSYHDTGSLYPEQMYQGFVVGLLAVLEPDYQVRSNRESGKGRPDVLIRPMKAGNPGVVLELKVAKPGRKTLDQALNEGLAQIAANDYGAELRAGGAGEVHSFAVALDGKEVRVRLGGSAGDRV